MSVAVHKISTAVIGCHGLDVLHMTRVKVAGSLLMAEYIQADVQPWERQKVDLLVAGIDEGQGLQLLREAAAAGTPVLAVTRGPVSGLDIAAVSHGASVREISRCLQQLLQRQAVAGEEGLPSRTLFRRLNEASGKYGLLHMGLVKVLVDAGRSRVMLVRDIPYEQCLETAMQPGWSMSLLEAPDEVQEHLDDVTSRHAFEDFCWRAAVLSGEPLPAPVPDTRVQLRGWPEVEAGCLPVQWLLPMSALLMRPWESRQLAAATGTSLEVVARIMAVAAFTGLLDTSGNGEPVARADRRTVSAFFSRVARRFGLNFSKGFQV